MFNLKFIKIIVITKNKIFPLNFDIIRNHNDYLMNY